MQRGQWQMISHSDGRPKSPIELTDEELRNGAVIAALNTPYSYDDFVAEMDRRARNRQARASTILAIVSAVIATVAVMIAAAKP